MPRRPSTRLQSRRGVLETLGATSLLTVTGCVDDGGGTAGDDADRDGATDAGGPPSDGDWELTFEDEFDGGQLDEDAWSYGMGGATRQCPPHDGPDHCWARDHVRVEESSDRLRLRASAEQPAGDAGHTMGAVCTDPEFRQEFGYFEARCRMDAEDGTLPAFWMLSDFDDHRYRELTFEARGIDDGESIHFGYLVEDEDGYVHDSSGPGRPVGGHYDDLEQPLDEAYHVLGIEWTPEAAAFYVDGEAVVRHDTTVVQDYFPGAPMYLICNQGVMDPGDWVGDAADADFPCYHDVDWVRAWQRADLA